MDNSSFVSFPRLRLERPTIAIVGGGASGVLTAIHLLRRRAPVRIVLVEERPQLGRGVAYSTTVDAHLLNVPVSNMSAYPEEPRHFLQWARDRRPGVESGCFLPRRLYGEYLEWCLQEEIAQARRRTPFTAVQGRVVGIAAGPGGAGLRLASGDTIWAAQVVLAVGHSTGPARPPATGSSTPGAIRDAWDPAALEGLPAGRPVVLIGTGLTAVDVVLSLDEAGFDGPIHAVSRRGLLPQPHRPAGPGAAPPGTVTAVAGPLVAPERARELLAAVRSEIRLAAALGQDWRRVVDGLRPRTQALWAALPEAERARLYRHAIRYWEVHRHRMAPEIAARIKELRRAGRLHVRAGRIASITPTADGVAVTLRRPQAVLEAGAVIRCTGPKEQLAAVGDPLLDGLFASGDARPGPVGLGLAVDPDGRLVGRHGVSESLWAIGPLRRGELLETTAIPEIRVQAAALARLLPEAAAAVETLHTFEEAL